MAEKLYLNVNRLQGELLTLYKEVLDKYLTDDNRDFLMSELSDEYLEDMAYDKAYEINRDMGIYLNGKDHKIFGNINNVDYDYPAHINGKVEYNASLVNAMIARLNSGEESEQADADRNWLVDWFWSTFGTFGIQYNFGEYVGALLDEFENEDEKV